MLIEDILIALLSLENHGKWHNYECSKFYDFALSSTGAIFHAMAIHDLNIVINVLRKWKCVECPVGIKLNGSKLQKANQLGFILGHTDIILLRRMKTKMKSLQELASDEIKMSVPVDFLRVALTQFEFRIMLPLWMERCPLQISYKIPIEPDTFDVFSCPEFNVRQQ